MNDKTRGLYPLYQVIRLDGSSRPGGRHEACFHFVLDADHDPCALPALLAYADACERDYPLLAQDLRIAVRQGTAALREREEARGSDPRFYEKPKLRLLMEALEREQGPQGPHTKQCTVSEYTLDVARHAKECLVELRALFPNLDLPEESAS